MSIRFFVKLDNLKKHKKILEGFDIKKVEDLEDSKNYYSSSMILFTMLNDLIALAEDFLIFMDLPFEERYQDLFSSLKKEGYLSSKEHKMCLDWVILRNTIAHEYEKVKVKELFQLINELDEIEVLAEKLYEYLKEEK